MPRGLIVVKAAYDADAAVWYVESSDLEGVNAEAPSLEALLAKLPGVVRAADVCKPDLGSRPRSAPRRWVALANQQLGLWV